MISFLFICEELTTLESTYTSSAETKLPFFIFDDLITNVPDSLILLGEYVSPEIN